MRKYNMHVYAVVYSFEGHHNRKIVVLLEVLYGKNGSIQMTAYQV